MEGQLIFKGNKTMTETNNTETVTAETETQPQTQQKFASIEEYTQITGKRFRLLRVEKLQGMSREEAFKNRGMLRE